MVTISFAESFPAWAELFIAFYSGIDYRDQCCTLSDSIVEQLQQEVISQKESDFPFRKDIQSLRNAEI